MPSTISTTLRLQEWEGRARNQVTTMKSQQRRLELLDEIILPEARRTLDSTLQAYRTDRATLTNWYVPV